VSKVDSFFGFLWEWKGLANLLYTFHDDSNLIEDTMDTVPHLVLEVIKRTVKDIKVDQGSFWEDMCYNASPMISLAMVRKKYGKELILSGNIDKRALAKAKEAIGEEAISKVPFLLKQGGYFPSVGHGVAPDVTFESHCYCINTLRQVAELERLSFQ